MLGITRTKIAAQRLALKDAEFLASLKSASLSELEAMLQNHQHKQTPRWKRVAIRIAISRHSPKDQTWIHGLDELRRRESHMEPWKLALLEETRLRLLR